MLVCTLHVVQAHGTFGGVMIVTISMMLPKQVAITSYSFAE